MTLSIVWLRIAYDVRAKLLNLNYKFTIPKLSI